MKKVFLALLKAGFALLALYLVYRKTDLQQIWLYLRKMEPLYVVGCFVVLKLAQLVSALRMRFYFFSAGLQCSRYFSVALNYVGMLFNMMLPGGVGGDGYKVIVMKRLENFPRVLSLLLMLSNRANGLFVLLLYTLILLCMSRYIQFVPLPALSIPVVMVMLIVGYFLSAKWLLRERFDTALKASVYSFAGQGLSLLSGALLFRAMGLSFHDWVLFMDYLVLFMLSSIASILPISLGGAGLREITFVYGSHYLQLDPELGVAFSLVYFALNTVMSLFGLLFLHRMKHIHANQKSELI